MTLIRLIAVPCASCIKRGCQDLCPDGVLPSKNAKCVLIDTLLLTISLEAAKDNLESRIQMLESILKEHNIPVPDLPSPAAASPASGPPRRAEHLAAGEEDWIPSFGTLVLGEAGRSRFVGPSAASEWLNQVSQTSRWSADSSRQKSRNLSTKRPCQRTTLCNHLTPCSHLTSPPKSQVTKHFLSARYQSRLTML